MAIAEFLLFGLDSEGYPHRLTLAEAEAYIAQYKVAAAPVAVITNPVVTPTPAPVVIPPDTFRYALGDKVDLTVTLFSDAKSIDVSDLPGLNWASGARKITGIAKRTGPFPITVTADDGRKAIITLIITAPDEVASTGAPVATGKPTPLDGNDRSSHIFKGIYQK